MQGYLDRISKDYGNKGSQERTQFFLNKLGIKKHCFDVVHVTGTNGKGSVCYKIAKGLSKGVKKIGLFTSPHLSCFTERIQIDFKPIDKKEAFKILEKIYAMSQEYNKNLCFFDCMCILAFYYFHQNKISLALIEAGVGGKEDQTNFVSPILSIITNISLDHQDRLGETLSEIAEQKAGIIKPSVPVVLGSKSLLKPVLLEAKKKNANIHIVESKNNVDLENYMIAKTSLMLLKDRYSLDSNVFEGLNENLECRFELLEGRYILDIAHNQIALLNLFKKVNHQFGDRLVHTIVSMCSHKNLKECLELVKNNSDETYIFHPPRKKLATREQMLNHLPNANVFDSVFLALEAASKKDGLVLCCGSAYFMKEVKEYLNHQKFAKSLGHMDKQNLKCNSRLVCAHSPKSHG